MRGLSALEVCNNNSWKIVGIANCLSRSGRPLPHSRKLFVENANGARFSVWDSYGSFVGATTNGFLRYMVNNENLWSATTKRAFDVKIDQVRKDGWELDELVDALNKLNV